MLKLRNFQKEDIRFMAKHNFRVLNANAPGTGKTIECLASLRIYETRLTPTLVVCPASVLSAWRQEAKRWVGHFSVHVITGTTEPLPREVKHLYITSWSILFERVRELYKLPIKCLIADEVHYAKNDETYRSSALSALAEKTPHLIFLSGTPLINNEDELKTLQAYFGKKKPPMLRRLIEDVAKDIPPKTRALLKVQLPGKYKKEYERAEIDFQDWLEDQLNARLEAGEAREAAQRALSSEALVKIGYLRRLLGVGKVRAAVDWIARAVRVGEPVVAFAEHSDVIGGLERGLKKQRIPYVKVVGSTTKNGREQAIRRFQRGEIPVFIGSKAAKEGITLTRARNLLFVERYWTAAEEEQAEDRIRRIGQKYKTRIWYLHVPNTIDERLEAIVETKRRLMRRKIGAKIVARAESSEASALITQWGKALKGDAGPTTKLGLGKMPPALPKIHSVYSIIFKGGRWDGKRARMWTKMFHYPRLKTEVTPQGVKVTCAKPSDFLPGTFRSVVVSKDIKILIGKRIHIPKKNRKKARSGTNKLEALGF